MTTGKQLIDQEYAERVVSLLKTRHGGFLHREQFAVEGKLVGDVVTVRLTLFNADRTFVYDMEAAAKLDDRLNVGVSDALELAVDFLDWYLGEYFRQSRELLLPLDFKPHRFGDYEVYAKGDVRNEVLEDLADAWLRGERPEIPDTVKKKPRR